MLKSFHVFIALGACVVTVVSSADNGVCNDDPRMKLLTNYNPLQVWNKDGGGRLPPSVSVEFGDVPRQLHYQYVYEWANRHTLHKVDLPLMILEVGGVPYKATFMSKTTFHGGVKPKSPIGRVPILDVVDKDGTNVTLCQRNAIVQYLADLAGLNGKSPLERARVASEWETFRELFIEMSEWNKWDIETLKAGPTKGERQLTFRETTNDRSRGGPYTPFQIAVLGFRTFEDRLEKSGKYAAGLHLSFVDLALVIMLEDLSLVFKDWPDKLALPRLKALYDEVTGMPALAEYERSGRRLPHFNEGHVVRKKGFIKYAESFSPIPTECIQLLSTEL